MNGVRNVDILREQLHACEGRANRAELGLLNLRDLQDRVGELEEQLRTWQAVSDAQTPAALTQVLVSLQQQSLAGREQLGDRSSQLAAAQGGSVGNNATNSVIESACQMWDEMQPICPQQLAAHPHHSFQTGDAMQESGSREAALERVSTWPGSCAGSIPCCEGMIGELYLACCNMRENGAGRLHAFLAN